MASTEPAVHENYCRRRRAYRFDSLLAFFTSHPASESTTACLSYLSLEWPCLHCLHKLFATDPNFDPRNRLIIHYHCFLLYFISHYSHQRKKGTSTAGTPVAPEKVCSINIMFSRLVPGEMAAVASQFII